MSDYPERSEGPAAYCYPHTVASLADPEQHAVLSLFARPAIYDGEAALIIEPLPYTHTGRTPGFGYWGNCWSIHLHDVDFRDRVSHLAAPGWSATVTPGPEPSAPVVLRLAHAGGDLLFDGGAPLPPDRVARVRVHPEGVPVFCGPCAGRPVPQGMELDAEDVDEMLATMDLVAARIPFTVAGVA